MNDIILNGERVEVLTTGIKGIVTGTCVSGIDVQFVEYKVTYWVGGDRKNEWLLPKEIKIHQDNSVKPGLVNYEKSIMVSAPCNK